MCFVEKLMLFYKSEQTMRSEIVKKILIKSFNTVHSIKLMNTISCITLDIYNFSLLSYIEF